MIRLPYFVIQKVFRYLNRDLESLGSEYLFQYILDLMTVCREWRDSVVPNIRFPPVVVKRIDSPILKCSILKRLKNVHLKFYIPDNKNFNLIETLYYSHSIANASKFIGHCGDGASLEEVMNEWNLHLNFSMIPILLDNSITDIHRLTISFYGRESVTVNPTENPKKLNCDHLLIYPDDRRIGGLIFQMIHFDRLKSFSYGGCISSLPDECVTWLSESTVLDSLTVKVSRVRPAGVFEISESYFRRILTTNRSIRTLNVKISTEVFEHPNTLTQTLIPLFRKNESITELTYDGYWTLEHYAELLQNKNLQILKLPQFQPATMGKQIPVSGHFVSQSRIHTLEIHTVYFTNIPETVEDLLIRYVTLPPNSKNGSSQGDEENYTDSEMHQYYYGDYQPRDLPPNLKNLRIFRAPAQLNCVPLTLHVLSNSVDNLKTLEIDSLSDDALAAIKKPLSTHQTIKRLKLTCNLSKGHLGEIIRHLPPYLKDLTLSISSSLSDIFGIMSSAPKHIKKMRVNYTLHSPQIGDVLSTALEILKYNKELRHLHLECSSHLASPNPKQISALIGHIEKNLINQLQVLILPLNDPSLSSFLRKNFIKSEQ